MNINKDYYYILELSRKATLQQIKSSYRKLALKFHPDRVPADLKKDGESIFQDINEAYQVLSNPQAKDIYDKELDCRELYADLRNDLNKKRRNIQRRFVQLEILGFFTTSKVLSAIVYASYFYMHKYTLFFIHSETRVWYLTNIALILIWFGKLFEYIDSRCPEMAFVVLGWLLLIGTPFLALCLVK